MTWRTNIYRTVGPGERQHQDDEACWCAPAVLRLPGVEPGGHVNQHATGEEHLVIDHRAGVAPAVAAALAAEAGYEISHTIPLRAARGRPRPA